MRVIINNNKSLSRLVSVESNSFLLDGTSGSTGGFSLRKLKSSYSGSAIRVRRASDNNEQNIGFSNNELDVASLNTFCSGTNGFVTTWYNQSDTSNNAIQTASANQPKIYDSSTGCETENGKPTIFFDYPTYLEVTDVSFGNVADLISNFTVASLKSSGITQGNFPTIMGKGTSGQGNSQFFTFRNDVKKYSTRMDGYLYNTNYDNIGSQNLLSNINLTGTDGIKVYANGSLISTKTTTADLIGTNSIKFSIGRNLQGSSNYVNGTIQELVLFSNDQTTNRAAIETNINTYYSIYGLLLDTLSDSTGGFSLRKLKSSYSGGAIQVRRASDNTTQNIGFVNNQLDVASLNTFCSGTDGFVTIWYNQSDTSNNAIQTASANQPKIYDATTGVELENGKPAIKFVKANSNWLEVTNTSFGNVGDAISNFSVFKVNTGTTNFPVIFSKSYNSDGSIAFNLISNGTRLDMWIDTVKSFSGVGSDIRGSQVLFNNINLLGTNGLKIYIDSTLISQKTSSQALSGTNPFKFAIGRNSQDSSYYTDGTIQELILFSNDQTTNKAAIETDINTNYSIY